MKKLTSAPKILFFVLLATLLVSCEGQIGAGGGDPFDPDEVPPLDEELELLPRNARRLSAPQLRAAIIGATGFDYVGNARVSDPSAVLGSIDLVDAPLLEVYGATLGDPDYNYTTQPSLDANVTFAKLAEDGVRFACSRATEAEVVRGETNKLLLDATSADTLPSAESAIRDNIAHLALRYWGHELPSTHAEVDALVELFSVAHDNAELVDPIEDEEAIPPALQRTASAWRTVCIAMLQDPRFLTY